MILMSETTGMPVVPEGYYWEISKVKDNYCSASLRVWLMKEPKKKFKKKRKFLANFLYFFGNTNYVEMSQDYKNIYMDSVLKEAKEKGLTVEASLESFIRGSAKALVEEYRADLRMAFARTKLDKYLGTYPPKKLGD